VIDEEIHIIDMVKTSVISLCTKLQMASSCISKIVVHVGLIGKLLGGVCKIFRMCVLSKTISIFFIIYIYYTI